MSEKLVEARNKSTKRKLKSLFIGGLITSSSFLWYPQAKKQFIAKEQFEHGTKIQVKLIESKVIDKNGIGNEWSFQSTTGNSIEIDELGVSVNLTGKEKLEINSIATEEDESYDDIGKGQIVITPENLSNILSRKSIVDTVEVYEHHGRGRGHTAICIFEYSIKIDSFNIRN